MISIAFSFISYTVILLTKYNLIWRVYIVNIKDIVNVRKNSPTNPTLIGQMSRCIKIEIDAYSYASI